MPDLTNREKKIINDILFHLDGWRTNDHPKDTRKINSFIDHDDPHHDNMIRKEVSSREVLTAYDKAKIHALNYIKRKEFPNNPAIYQAICYWAAGLLSEKAHFKEGKIEQSTLLIEEARRLLSPHVKRNEDFFTVSGDEFLFEQYLRSESQPRPRRDRVPYDQDEDGGEPKERLIHGHFHDHRHKHHRKPKCDIPFPRMAGDDEDVDIDWISSRNKSKCDIKVEPIISTDGEVADIKAKVTRHGKPAKHGKLMFYIYEED